MTLPSKQDRVIRHERDGSTAESQLTANRAYRKKPLLGMSNHSLMRGGSSVIQPKLTVSSPNDQYEREADQIAEMVVGKSNHINLQQIPATRRALVQRQIETPSVAQSAGIPDSIKEVISSGRGKPLYKTSREFMELGFGGYDFGHVRIHDDAKAAESAEALGASAYTVGKDIVFGRGQYSPETSHGKRLLVHELTHVIQQSETSVQIHRQAEEVVTVEELKHRLEEEREGREEEREGRIEVTKLRELDNWFHQEYEVADQNSDHYRDALIELLIDLIKVPEGLSTLSSHIVDISLGGIGIGGTIVKLSMGASITVGGVSIVANLIWNELANAIDEAIRIQELEKQKASLKSIIREIFRKYGTVWFLKASGVYQARRTINRNIVDAKTPEEIEKIVMPSVHSVQSIEKHIAEVYKAWLLENTSVSITEKRWRRWGTMAWAKLLSSQVPPYIVRQVVKVKEEIGEERLITPDFIVEYYKRSIPFGVVFKGSLTYSDIALSKEKQVRFSGVPCGANKCSGIGWLKAVGLINFPIPEYGLSHEYPAAKKAKLVIPEFVELIHHAGNRERFRLIRREIVEMPSGTSSRW